MREIAKVYGAVAGITALFVLAGFAAFAAAGVELGTDVSGSPAPALVGVLLLVVDVLLPVPSSLVMVGFGASYGPIVGALLGAAGSLGALATGYHVGRAGTRFVDRVGTPAERARGHRMLRRWGPVAVIAPRPVPVLAETVAVLTGAAGLPRHHVLLAGTLGVTPMAAAYAMAGAWARDTGALGVVVFLLLIALAALTALALRRRATRNSTAEASR
jgi:uncharacterized membrane protein YdjX (TVP38/TMEM64 family)